MWGHLIWGLEGAAGSVAPDILVALGGAPAQTLFRVPSTAGTVLRGTVAIICCCAVGPPPHPPGREKDVAFFSTVRSQRGNKGIGFVADERRINVGLTRAR